jgi:hypothetical protein
MLKRKIDYRFDSEKYAEDHFFRGLEMRPRLDMELSPS